MQEIFIRIFIAAFAGYFLGSINGAQILHHLLRSHFPRHITRIGTKIAGTTNVWLYIGKTPALFVLAIDVFKGYLSILVAEIILGVDAPFSFIAGITAIAGHNWPIFFHFRGGRGVATLAGAVFALDFNIALIVGIASFIFIFIRWSGLHPFALIAGMTIFEYQQWGLTFVAIMILCALIIFAKRIQAYWTPLTRADKRIVPLKTLLFSIIWYDSAGIKPVPLRQLYSLKLLEEIKEDTGRVD